MNGRSVALAVLGVIVARTAAADGGGVVIESYTGARPDNAGRLLGPVLEELTTRGFAVGYDGVGRKFEAEVSRPGRTAGGLPGDFADAIARGHKAWVKGKFDDAVAILTPMIEAAHGNAAVVSQDQGLRDAVQAGLLDLALAQQRVGDPTAARETMGELLRSFPDAVISRAVNGPEAFELFDTTRKALAAGGRGSLAIEVADNATLVFLDEHYERTGAVHKTELIPGSYRVYAAIGQREGRIYQVDVRAGSETKLTVDIAFDAVLHVAPDWTGLAFTTAADREKLEAIDAATFARLARAPAVAVVGVDLVRGRLAIVGSLVALESGREIRRASLAIEPEPSSDRLRALARFLAGDDTARASLDVEDDPTAPRYPRDRATMHHADGSRWGALKYITAGVGLAAAGAGTYLLILDGNCSHHPPDPMMPCTDLYSTKVPGWSLVGGGAAVLGLGIYMFATDHRAERAVTLVPTRGGAMAWIRDSF